MPARRLTTEPLENRVSPAVFTVTTTADSGAGSLRQALLSANAAAGADTVAFALPAADAGHVYYRNDGVAGQVTLANVTPTTAATDSAIADIDPDWPHSWWTIAPTTALPFIEDNITIDGYTQPGATANTNPVGQGLNTVLRVEISGERAGDVSFTGLLGLRTTGSTVRGLVVNRSTGPRIQLENFSDIPDGNSVVAGNFIGPDVSGTVGFAAIGDGVFLRSSGTNVVGGTAAADRNLISANADRSGVAISAAKNNRVEGNLIGPDRTGTRAFETVSQAAGVSPSRATTVGGTDSNARNVISGNTIGVVGSGTVRGNLIGTDVTGTQPLGNRDFGVSGGNEIQVLQNVIAFNGTTDSTGGGVRIGANLMGGGGNLLSQNAVFSNGGLGIDLNGDRETPNDPLDADGGPNGLQNFPALTSATAADAGTRVVGTLPSAANANYRIEFFASRARDTDANRLDRSGRQGEGETFLGFVDVTTDAAGNAGFTADLPALPDGQPYVTATATDVTVENGRPRNNTSEFSQVVILGGPSFVVTSTADGGLGTLREAIFSSNFTPGFRELISFAIPAADPGHVYYRDDGIPGRVTPGNVTGTVAASDAAIPDIDPDWPHSWFRIRLSEDLPVIEDAVVIDGYSQPGSAANTSPAPGPLNTVLRIELDASGTTGSAIRIGGVGITQVSGLAVNRSAAHGLEVASDFPNRLTGNFVGTDVSGTVGLGNAGHGILLEDDIGTRVGGADPADRNLIAGNGGHGILADHTIGNEVFGNLIGADRTGRRSIGNGGSGVFVEYAYLLTVGGGAAGTSNLFGRNGETSVALAKPPALLTTTETTESNIRSEITKKNRWKRIRTVRSLVRCLRFLVFLLLAIS